MQAGLAQIFELKSGFMQAEIQTVVRHTDIEEGG